MRLQLIAVRFLVCLVLAPTPSLALAQARARVISEGPFVAGNEIDLILEIPNVSGQVRVMGPGVATRSAIKRPGTNQYVATLRLPSRPGALGLTVTAPGLSDSVVLDIVPGIRPVLGATQGALVAGERSRLLVQVSNLQRPIKVRLDNLELTDVSKVEANALVIEPLLVTAPASCSATLRVFNVGGDEARLSVKVASAQPVITEIQGRVIAGQPSQITIEGKRFYDGMSLVVDEGKQGTTFANAVSGISSQGEHRLVATLSLPARPQPYSARLRIANRCAAETTAIVQVKPADSSVTPKLEVPLK